MSAAEINEESIKTMTMFEIIEFLLTVQSENDVIKEHFTSVWPRVELHLESIGDNLEIRIGFQLCSLTFEERGSNVAVTIKSSKTTNTRVVTSGNAGKNTAACTVIDKILRGTQLDKLIIKRDEGNMSLDDLAAISSISNLRQLVVILDTLTEAEGRLLVTDFPNATEEMRFNIREEPQQKFSNVGSIVTRILCSDYECLFLTIDVLLNSRVPRIFLMRAKFDHFEMQLYLYSWQCGDNSSLEMFICRVDDDFDVTIPVNGVRSVTLTEAKQLSGKFKSQHHLEFHGLYYNRINGEDGFHMAREDGKIASFFKYKGREYFSTFLIFIWTDENPRKRNKSFRFRTNHGTSN